MTRTKPCRACGKPFAVSPANTTVNCPEHRGRTTTKRAKSYTAVACGRCGHVHTTLRCDRCGF